MGLLVVAFLVFVLWFFLLRPRDDSTPVAPLTPAPASVPTLIIDDPNTAFKSVIATPTPAPTPTPTPAPRPTPSPTVSVYTVQAGDTLSGIAERFGVTVEDLVRVNRILDRDSLQVGQEVTIP